MYGCVLEMREMRCGCQRLRVWTAPKSSEYSAHGSHGHEKATRNLGHPPSFYLQALILLPCVC